MSNDAKDTMTVAYCYEGFLDQIFSFLRENGAEIAEQSEREIRESMMSLHEQEMIEQLAAFMEPFVLFCQWNSEFRDYVLQDLDLDILCSSDAQERAKQLKDEAAE